MKRAKTTTTKPSGARSAHSTDPIGAATASPSARARRGSRTERLDARLSPAQKELIQRAADYQGRTLTDFVVASLHEAAVRVIEANETIVLGARDSRRFVDLLLEPPAPSVELRTAARAARRLIRA